MAILGKQGGHADLEQLVPEILGSQCRTANPHQLPPARLIDGVEHPHQRLAVEGLGSLDNGVDLLLRQLLGHGLQIVVAADAVVEIPYVVGLDGVLAPQILAHRQLEGGEALEPDLLGELHDARLADISLLGQLLGGEVSHLLRARQDVIGDLELAGGELTADIGNF